MNLLKPSKISLALLFAAAAATAQAQTLDEQLTITESILPNCELAKLQDLNFGSYLQDNNGLQPPAGDELARGIFDVTCGRDVRYSLSFGGSTNALGGVRRMRRDAAANCADPADCIFYRLYRVPNRNTQMVAIGSTVNFNPITAANHVRSHSLYGQFSNSLDYRPGNYSDTITITLSY